MNTITLLVIAGCLFQGISCARRRSTSPNPPSSQSENDEPPLDRSWVPPEFNYLPDDVIREIIREYEEINNPPPQKPLPPPFSPPNTDDLMPNVDPKIFNYKVGKRAMITSPGGLEIDGTDVFFELPELRSGHGYSILVQDGILSVNSKVVFKNDPASKVKIPWNHAKFSINGTVSLTMTVMADGTLKCLDDHREVIKLKPTPSPTLTKGRSIATCDKNALVRPVTPNKDLLNTKQPVPSTPKPTVTASAPTTSTPSPTTIKNNIQPIAPNTKGLAPNINQKIFSYRPGKTALITVDGSLKIGGKIIYKNLPELKPNAGYSIREQDGTLSVNGKVVFKNDPQFQFKIPRNMATNFKSDTSRLRITVLDDGTLKCVDNKKNVRTFS